MGFVSALVLSNVCTHRQPPQFHPRSHTGRKEGVRVLSVSPALGAVPQ